MPRRCEELIAEFGYERNVFGREDDRSIIGVLDDGGGEDSNTSGTVVKGKAREGELESGLTYRFYGYWTTHPKYGRQFAFQSFILAQPSGKQGTIAYLTRGPGIGPKRAAKLWDLYGSSALEVIRTDPARAAAECHGLTETKAREAAAYFQSHIAAEKTTQDLLELLSGMGTPRKLVDRLIERFGVKAAEKVKENPYSLIRFHGVGFGRSDRLYLQLGKDPAAPERLGWCAWHSLYSDRQGHTWLPVTVPERAIRDGVAGVQVDGVMMAGGLAWAIKAGHVAVRDEVVEGGGCRVVRRWMADGAKAAAETRLANCVWRAMVEDFSSKNERIAK
ncbi:MAG: helix-hairpin-helix domain-containing protein [Planctomycetaceae bacterium]